MKDLTSIYYWWAVNICLFTERSFLAFFKYYFEVTFQKYDFELQAVLLKIQGKEYSIFLWHNLTVIRLISIFSLISLYTLMLSRLFKINWVSFSIVFDYYCYTFKRQPHKMARHTHTIRRQSADELFECLTILWYWRLKGWSNFEFCRDQTKSFLNQTNLFKWQAVQKYIKNCKKNILGWICGILLIMVSYFENY